MGDAGYVPDTGHHQACGLQGTDGSFPASTGATNEDIHLSQPHVNAPASRLFRGSLGSEGGAFARTLEPHIARGGEGNDVALGIGKADQGVVERRLDVGAPLRYDATFSTT
jgi:hypothetical protein